MSGFALELLARDEADTRRIGERLAASLQPGDILLLSGPLGAGKTALARAVVRALSGDDALEVPSPSFSLVQPYETPMGAVLHADLYRLALEDEIEELGLFDDPSAIVMVEWPERAPMLGELASLGVDIALPPGGGRIVRIACLGSRAEPKGLRSALADLAAPSR
ncbi:MAG TPA: tRNA (adenosine(37)-N6)-threonylcarbamoyltransferase complex ATPase subunit type 1 TsaE [Devosiaceae bacterium]